MLVVDAWHIAALLIVVVVVAFVTASAITAMVRSNAKIVLRSGYSVGDPLRELSLRGLPEGYRVFATVGPGPVDAWMQCPDDSTYHVQCGSVDDCARDCYRMADVIAGAKTL
ncbi:hypothetical protein [Kordiimonas sp.]|uniref:hypothetical protein n=1 Tax=Kordiimonas sp. TaxID=1970157 RepID=UPI003A949D34